MTEFFQKFGIRCDRCSLRYNINSQDILEKKQAYEQLFVCATGEGWKFHPTSGNIIHFCPSCKL